MGPMKLYFDFRDIFRAPRLGLSGKKILVFTIANVIGWAVYWALTYLAYAVSGYSFSAMWNTYGLYPCLFGHPAPWYGWVLYILGLLGWFFSLNLACTAVVRITYKQLKGDEFFSSGDAWKYVKKHWYPIIFTSVSIIAIVVFFIVGAIIFGLFGKIPYVGEFLFSLPYLFYFFGSVFTLYTLVVLITAFIYTPAIVGVYEEDTMGTVFQSYSITWSQPWRVILYNLLLIPLAGIGIAVFRFFWLAGYNFINMVFGQSWLMGSKLTHIVGWATQVVAPGTQSCVGGGSCCDAAPQLGNSLTCLMKLPTDTALTGTEMASAIILSIFFFLLFTSVISYAFSVFSVGETLMFVIFKKKSDDENLLERKDEDELEEEDEDDDLTDFESDDEDDSSDDSDDDEDKESENDSKDSNSSDSSDE